MSPCIVTLNVNDIAVVSVEKIKFISKIDIETLCSIDTESKWKKT